MPIGGAVRIRRAVPGELGQRPTLLALQPGQQAPHIRHRLPPRLHPPEPVPHPDTQLIQPSRPLTDIDADRPSLPYRPRSNPRNHKWPLQY
jgi:hypothetical protein